MENGRVRALVGQGQLYSETGHRRRDFLVARMTESGRDRHFEVAPGSGPSTPPGAPPGFWQ
jgi:hypothetical protein